MVTISECKFGEIVVDGVKYGEDIVIIKGKVKPRLKELSKKYRDEYGHTPLSLEELKGYINECSDLEELIIATGHYGMMPLTPEAKNYIDELAKRGVKVVIDRTPKVLEEVKKAIIDDLKFIAIIHITC